MELQAFLEEQQADAERDDREEGLAEDLVRLNDAKPGPDKDPTHQQQKDRREPDRSPEPLGANANDDDDGNADCVRFHLGASTTPRASTARRFSRGMRTGA